jgi:hypothetical protein
MPTKIQEMKTKNIDKARKGIHVMLMESTFWKI